MLYAQVIVALKPEGPFDYSVPDSLVSKAKLGSRVRVNFGSRKISGYITGISKKSDIKNIKPLLSVLDEEPVLTEAMLLAAKELSEYYCCSQGQMAAAMLPQGLR